MTHSNQEVQKTLCQVFVWCKTRSVHSIHWSYSGWHQASHWLLHIIFCLWNPGKQPFWSWAAPRAISERSMAQPGSVLSPFPLTSSAEWWSTASETKYESHQLCWSVHASTPGDKWHDLGEVTSQFWALTLAPLWHDEGRIFPRKRRMSTPLNFLSFPGHPARHSRRQHCLLLHKHTPSKTWKPHTGTAHRQRSCSCN